MAFGVHQQLILMGLLLAVAALLVAAPALHVPYPILLVLGGLALGFLPGVPSLQLPPDLVLIAVLPPLLYSTAFFTSLRELRENIRPIGMLAIGLVLVTMTAVAVVAHAMVDNMSWSAAFVLGAVVAPTDPLAASAIMRRLGVPRRAVTIVEGESLVNDGTALVLYRVAVTAAVAGTFSIWDASWRLLWSVVGGVAIGLVVGFLVAAVRRRIDNPQVEVTIALITGYLAFIPANAAEASGVLAVVTAGIYLGWRTPELTSFQTRLSGSAVWEIFTFVINALLFALIGLQLPSILDALTGFSAAKLIWWAVIVSGTVVVTRLVFVPVFTYLPRRFLGSFGENNPAPPVNRAAVVAWAGMRGAVSLAAALAVPLTTDAGQPFPERDLIVFLTFCVILGTLVVQGLTLPVAIRLLGIEADHLDEKEEAKARIKAADAAIERLAELEGEDWVRDDTAERLRGLYGFRRNRFASRFDRDDDGSIEEQSLSYQRLRRELLDAERTKLVDLRRQGVISSDVERRLHRDLDLEDARLDV
ncbi:MAG: monovalent cation/hydrogen antiporter [Gaiellaceae bacterium]|nr:monovalent cation/hydrogen antiporter [Gaiellaceae bacterium]